jgi:hypothetical protein
LMLTVSPRHLVEVENVANHTGGQQGRSGDSANFLM